MIRRASLLLAIFVGGCVEQPQTPVTYRAYVRGAEDASHAFGDWSVRLSRAELALGPLYFCASTTTDGCDAAVQELAACATLDALESTSRELGEVRGVTGSLRSATYDLGITWLLTDARPRASACAPDGHSLVLEGTALHADARSFSFRAEVDVAPPFSGASAVANQSIVATIDDADARLDIGVDPFAWLEGIDFDALHDTAVDGETLIRAGYPARGDGSSDPRARAREFIAQGVTNRARPTFTWSASHTVR